MANATRHPTFFKLRAGVLFIDRAPGLRVAQLAAPDGLKSENFCRYLVWPILPHREARHATGVGSTRQTSDTDV